MSRYFRCRPSCRTTCNAIIVVVVGVVVAIGNSGNAGAFAYILFWLFSWGFGLVGLGESSAVWLSTVSYLALHLYSVRGVPVARRHWCGCCHFVHRFLIDTYALFKHTQRKLSLEKCVSF